VDATFVLQGPNGTRRVKAEDFFQGTYMTALADDELLVGIRVPAFAPGTGWAYEKLKRKTGDWATAGAAVVLRMAGGKVTHARIALTNVGATALRAAAAEAALIGQPLGDASVRAAAAAAQAICDPAEDLRGDREYKLAMAGQMVQRAVRAAAARCA
jgi:carbon-monoxide dehydrogenase medium subunit